jgi:diguanylate cyclase (GGDEF)-like protein
MIPSLHQRVNRSLLALAALAAAIGSSLLASVSGVLVLNATLDEAQKHVKALERDLTGVITSFQPLYEVQRQLQLAASSRELSSALLISSSGRVLAASNNALVGRNVRELGAEDDLGDLPQHLQACVVDRGSGLCPDHRSTSLFHGPLPLIGGNHLIRFVPTPMALEGLPAFGQQGLLVIEVDLQPLVQQAVRLTFLVFAAGLLPLFLTAGAMVLVVRRQLLPELLALAQTDGLSGVMNRRAFMEAASQRLKLSRDRQTPCVVALIDIDHFKMINDGYGHATGDEVIRRMADFLNTAVRRTDLVGRLGGDEFALLVEVSRAQAYELLERLRQRVAAHDWTLAADGQLQLSLSVGMVESGGEAGYDLDDLLQAADAALYLAKDQGRNRVIDLQRDRPAGWVVHMA